MWHHQLKTSSTCYYKQCTFCAHYAHVPYFEADIELIRQTIVKSGQKHFYLIDDMVPAKRLLKLAALFNPLQISWSCQLKPTRSLDFKTLQTLHDSGLSMIMWGVESGCQRILDLIDKGTNVNEVEEILKNSYNAGIKNSVYAFGGFPTEKEEEYKATIEFLERNREYIDLQFTGLFRLTKDSRIASDISKFGIVGRIDHSFICLRTVQYGVRKQIEFTCRLLMFLPDLGQFATIL